MGLFGKTPEKNPKEMVCGVSMIKSSIKHFKTS